MESLAVIKYGGHAMTDKALAKAFFQDIATLTKANYPCVIVHGGGPQINELLDRLNIKSSFVKGLRKTDDATMEVVEMVLAGKVNKDLVAELANVGVKACGISGRDANLFSSEPYDEELGLVGKITQVNPQILKILLEAHITPVVAPTANNHENQAYNVNADTAAGCLAGLLKAKYFVLISDVQGVLDSQGQVIPKITQNEALELIKKEVITKGMIPKVTSCLSALEQGAKSALILDGRKAASLSGYLLKNEPLGTLVLKD